MNMMEMKYENMIGNQVMSEEKQTRKLDHIS